MSKHKTPEDKLHVSQRASISIKKFSQRLLAKARRAEPMPSKGTNGDNQFR